MLFCRLISEYYSIPFHSIRKDGAHHEAEYKESQCFVDILMSVLKGLVEDTHGGIKDDAHTPLPYLSFIQNKVRYLVYCPVQNEYEERIENTRPMADILVHLFDINLFKSDTGVQDGATLRAVKQNMEVIKTLRYKKVMFGVNKMDSVEWDSLTFHN